MVKTEELLRYCSDLLQPALFQDYCPNGLQVEGRPEIRRLVTGVTASLALLERAVEIGADAVLVHHGLFWKGDVASVTGIRRRRLKQLLEHDINLLAYHLPLDAHGEVGNNVQLARVLGWPVSGGLQPGARNPIGNIGDFAEPVSACDFKARMDKALGRSSLHIDGGDRSVRRIAWCTGAAQSYFEEAIALGVDAFISGEISEQTVHLAREWGVHYFAAGHHATERYGVQALGDRLAARFHLDCQFVDIDSPV